MIKLVKAIGLKERVLFIGTRFSDLDFEAILAPPSERFYYHAQWCGLSEGAGSWFSCASSA